MRVLELTLTTPIRTATVVLTSKEIVAIRSLLKNWMDTEGKRNIEAGFGFATEHIAGMLSEFAGLYELIWPLVPEVNPATGQTPE